MQTKQGIIKLGFRKIVLSVDEFYRLAQIASMFSIWNGLQCVVCFFLSYMAICLPRAELTTDGAYLVLQNRAVL